MSNSKGVSNKKKVLIAGGVVILAVAVVASCIYFKPKRNEEEIVDESKLIVNEPETYEGLNYSVEKVNLLQQSFFYDLDRGIEGSKIDLSFLKVAGLKDKSLEEKINNSLKETAESMHDSTSLENSKVLYDHVYNATDVYIFNNVLSTMYCRELCDIEGNISYEYKGININLKDYNEFGFKDVFVNTANLSDILKPEIKNNVDNGSIIFSVSPKNIYVYNDVSKKIETINLYKNREYIAIYKRYANNKKLFEKTYNAKPYVFTTKKFYETDNYGLVENNLFIDTVNKYASENTNYSKEVMDGLNTLYKSAVSAAKSKAFSNPSKRYLVQIIPNISKTQDDYLNLSVTYTIFEIQKEFFNSNIEKFIIGSENREEEEIVKIAYFNNPIMDANNYLMKTETEIIEKIVDSNGNEKVEKTIMQGES